MAVNTTGAEFKVYYNDSKVWPEGACHFDTLIIVDGVEADGSADLSEVADSAQIKIEAGVVFMSDGDYDGNSMEAHFRSWKKNQTTVRFVVECAIEKQESIANAVKSVGGRVLK